MTFTIVNADQRSDAWFAARIGRVTGSCAKHVLAKGKGSDEAVTRRDYRFQLVTERLTGRSQSGSTYVNDDMQRGIEMEPVARAAYEAHSGALVRQTGFLAADDLMVGCSLDGDIDNLTGIVEIKAPKSATHARYIKAFQSNPTLPPAEHAAQILHNLWVSGAQFCEFVSWDDRFPPSLQLVVFRIARDEEAIALYAKKVRAFLEEVDAEHQALLTLANPTAQLEASLAV